MPESVLTSRGSVTRAFVSLARIAAGLVVLVSLMVLCGWALDIESFKRIRHGFVAMNPLTAVSFLVAGTMLYWLTRPHLTQIQRNVIFGAGAFLVLISSVRLVGYFYHVDVGIDQWLFASKLDGRTDPQPNRMAPNTAMNLLLVGLAIMLVDCRTAMGQRPGQWFALASSLYSLLAVIGYVYNVSFLYGVSSHIPMALHTAVLLILTSLGIMFARPESGFMTIVSSNSTSGVLTRRLLPAAVIVPITLGWLELAGRQRHWYESAFGASLLVLTIITFMLVLVWWTASLLYAMDQRRAKAEAQITRARDDAEAANRAKSDFLANMSHEIRTPMTAIIGFAELMREPNLTNAERIRCLNTIRFNGDHLLTIINDILDLSKIEAREMKPELIECSPMQILSQVASLMRVRAREQNLQLDVVIRPPVPRTIICDPTRLRQILLNLLSNAIKFTKKGGVKVVMQMADVDDPQRAMLRFDVIDTGIGLNDAQIRRLFQPFAQADNSTTRRFGGTGLGLAISQRLARLLGGDIIVESKPGKGSTFSLTISVGTIDELEMLQQTPSEIIHELPEMESMDTLGLVGHVLLAEDGIHNQQLLNLYLTKAGAEVTVVDNGKIACEYVQETRQLDDRGRPRRKPFDLVLMDMQMPEMDGYDATRKLRAEGFTRPIIALTAHAMAEDRDKCLRVGCTDYLSKPVTKNLLLSTVKQYLNVDEAVTTQVFHQLQLSEAKRATVTPGTPDGTLYSQVEDEVILPFLSSFVEQLPKQVRSLLDSAQREDLRTLGRVTHCLKGTGGLYGFAPITEHAMVLEQAMQLQENIDDIRRQVQKLVQVIRRVDGYEMERELLVG